MPLQHAVLALLADGPSYGYQLKDRFEHAVGPHWGLNVGHLYQVLDRLRRDGLATTEIVPQAQHPDRTVFRISAAGRVELDSWLATPAGRSRGYRDDFFLKLMAAAHRDRATLDTVLRAQRTRHLQELRSIAELRATVPGDVISGLLLHAAALHTQADLALLDEAEERAAELLIAVQDTDSQGAADALGDGPVRLNTQLHRDTPAAG